MRQPTPEEIVAKMIALHAELGNFQYYLARQSTPPRWEGKEYDACSTVAMALEREIKRMQLLVKDRNLDSLVLESLKNAGFKPDEPPATDTK